MLKNEHVRSMNFNDYIFSTLGEYMSMCMLEKHVYVADLVTV